MDQRSNLATDIWQPPWSHDTKTEIDKLTMQNATSLLQKNNDSNTN